MKTLITGATGLLGGNLARLLARRGEGEVRALVRENSKTYAIDGLPVERVLGDVRDRASVDRAVRGCDRVVHCAASTSQWRPSLAKIREINVTGTVNVLEAARQAGMKRAVHVSTVDTLGLSSREHPADESSEHESLAAFHNPYVDTKFEAEQRALEIAARGLDLVIVKPSFMIGEWDARPSSGQMVVGVALGIARGYPAGGNNFVDVRDVAEGIRLALDKGRAGEAYILANAQGNLTYREFFTLTARIVGVRPPGFPIPYAAALAGGYLMDLVGRARGIEPDLNSVIARMAYAGHYFTPKKAIAELGLPQSPIADAIARAYAWFKEHRMIRYPKMKSPD